MEILAIGLCGLAFARDDECRLAQFDIDLVGGKPCHRQADAIGRLAGALEGDMTEHEQIGIMYSDRTWVVRPWMKAMAFWVTILALGGLTMAQITGDPRWDAVGSISIGILLVLIAIVLAIEMKGLLIGESTSEQVTQAIEHAINGAEQVNGLIHLRCMHLGPEDIIVAAKIDFDHSLTMTELAAAVDRTEVAIRAAAPLDMTIYIEPDIRRATTA
jgi:hypothetical protein